MTSGSPWLTALALFSHNAWLVLGSAFVMGFTIFGGIYSLLFNLYLLRLGYDLSFIGLVNAVALLGWALACLPAGSIGGWLGSRTAMILGLGLALLGYLLVPLCELFPPGVARSAWLIGSYLAGNVFIALYDVNSQPFLAAASSPVERDHLFATQAALWPVAAFLGSLAGGLLPGIFGVLLPAAGPSAPYRYSLILCAALLGFGVWALLATREGRTPAHQQQTPPVVSSKPANPLMRKLPSVGVLFLGFTMFLQGTGEGAVRTFFNVYLDSTYRVPTEVLGVLAASGNLLGAVAALLMPAISRRIGHKSLFVFGTLGISASLALLFFLPGVLAASLGFILVIVLVSVTRPAVLVYLMSSAAEKVRTLLSGVYTMAMGLSWSAVALLGALVLSSLGYPVFFLLCAGFVAISAMTFAAQRSEQYD